MDERCATGKSRRWEDMEIDILVRIFETLGLHELISGVAHVCRGWRLACCDPLLWKTLDLSMVESNFIKIPTNPYVYVASRSDSSLNRVLKIALNLSKGSIQTLIFHVDLFVKDELLLYTAERCPKLKRLILPAWNRIRTTEMCKAIQMWPHLESLTMPSITRPNPVMEEILQSCPNFTQLKIMGPFDMVIATSLASYLPHLKALSLRCCLVHKEALLFILDNLVKLEVLNICHCFLVETLDFPESTNVVRVDRSIIAKACRIRQFLFCPVTSVCLMCERAKADEGLMRWYKYEKGLWKEDESRCLAV